MMASGSKLHHVIEALHIKLKNQRSSFVRWTWSGIPSDVVLRSFPIAWQEMRRGHRLVIVTDTPLSPHPNEVL